MQGEVRLSGHIGPIAVLVLVFSALPEATPRDIVDLTCLAS